MNKEQVLEQLAKDDLGLGTLWTEIPEDKKTLKDVYFNKFGVAYRFNKKGVLTYSEDSYVAKSGALRKRFTKFIEVYTKDVDTTLLKLYTKEEFEQVRHESLTPLLYDPVEEGQMRVILSNGGYVKIGSHYNNHFYTVTCKREAMLDTPFESVSFKLLSDSELGYQLMDSRLLIRLSKPIVETSQTPVY